MRNSIGGGVARDSAVGRCSGVAPLLLVTTTTVPTERGGGGGGGMRGSILVGPLSIFLDSFSSYFLSHVLSSVGASLLPVTLMCCSITRTCG